MAITTSKGGNPSSENESISEGNQLSNIPFCLRAHLITGRRSLGTVLDLNEHVETVLLYSLPQSKDSYETAFAQMMPAIAQVRQEFEGQDNPSFVCRFALSIDWRIGDNLYVYVRHSETIECVSKANAQKAFERLLKTMVQTVRTQEQQGAEQRQKQLA